MKHIKKIISLLALCSIAVVGVGCSTGNSQTTPPTVSEENKKPEQETQDNGTKEQKETLKITHEYGEVEVPKNPTSVVVTDFGILDSIHALGVESVTGVPQDSTSIPTYLKAYAEDQYVNVGGLKEPNFEVLYELEPEIIFIGARLANQYEELSKIAPVVYISIDTTNYMASLEENTTLLGNIFGKEEEAKKLMEEMYTQIESVKQIAEEKEANALITMVNKGEVSVFGEHSRFGIVHNTLGLQVADTNIDDSTHGQTVTFEYLLQINPEYLFVVDKNAIGGSAGGATQTAKDTLTNSIVKQMSAAQEGKIIYLDPVAWYLTSGGIEATKIMIQEINDALTIDK